MKKIFLPFITIVFLCEMAAAQLAIDSSGHNSNLPVEITSEHLEVLQNKEQAIFSGNVKAKQDKITLYADEMHVFYNTKRDKIGKAQSSVSKVEAKGNVKFESKTESAKSDFGIFDVAANTVTLTGKVELASGKNVAKGEKFVYNLTTGQSKLVNGSSDETGKKGRVRGVFVPR